MNTKKHLDKKVVQLLNEQIAKESNASYTYLAMALWASHHNYEGSASFFYQQAEEERAHMLKIVHYLIEQGHLPTIPSQIVATTHYGSLKELFEKMLSHEQKITESIHDIVTVALEVKDYTTFQFLQWFIAEQREEEAKAQQVLGLFETVGEGALGYYTIDQALDKLAQKKG